jgi:glyceraldehyde 3-phosphate dehydrogenase
MAILNLTLDKAVERDTLNDFMRDAALRSSLLKQIDYTESPEVVSSDFVGSRTACIYDAKATITNGNSAVIYLWYDNEFGYTCQVHRVLEKFAGAEYASYPKKA